MANAGYPYIGLEGGVRAASIWLAGREPECRVYACNTICLLWLNLKPGAAEKKTRGALKSLCGE